jgi:hypothetical protein
MNPEKMSNNMSLQDAIAPLTKEEERLDAPHPSQSFPTPQHTDGPLQSLRTFQGDIESLVDHGKTSVVSIAMAEQKREEERPETKIKPDEPSFFSELRNKSFVTAAIIILILGVAIVSGVFALRYFTVPASIQVATTLVSFNKEVALNVASSSRETLVSQIQNDIQTFSMGENSILYLNTNGTDSQTFMQLLAPSIPPVLLRSLNASYMVGVYAFNGNEPFIILTTSDYASSFSGMLAWEKTMPEDLGEVFTIPAHTSTDTSYIFTDEQLSNKDLRILKDQNGKTILLYSFLDKNTILITANEDIFSAMLGKYETSQLVR